MKLQSKFFSISILVLIMAFTWTSALANERVAMQSPAKDAAYVPFLLGMVNNFKSKDLYGVPKTVNDGLVIRQSSIKDGKIIIPPGGLYVTSRSDNWIPFRATPMTIAGKEYFVATDLSERNIIKDITLKKGEIVAINPEKTRGFELSSISFEPYALPGQHSATFKIVKATGNYYGSPFPVYAGDMFINIPDGTLAKGTNEPVGTTVPTVQNKLSEMMYASDMFSVGRSHVIIDSIDKDSVKVRELATDSTTDLFITATQPSVKSVKKGDTFKDGKASIKILDVTKDSVKISLTDSKGSIEKVLGPVNDKTTEWVGLSMTARDPFWVRSPDGTGLITLDLYKKDGPINMPSANLVVYNNIIHIQNSSPWAADPRFVAIPET